MWMNEQAVSASLCLNKLSGIIFISSENEELLGICDRIAVMSKGRIVKEFSSDDVTEHDILYWAAGGDGSDRKGEADIE